MSKVFHDEIDSGTIYVVLLRIPEAEEFAFDWISGEADIEDLGAVLLPEIGEDPRHWPDWSDAIVEAMLMYRHNVLGELDLVEGASDE